MKCFAAGRRRVPGFGTAGAVRLVKSHHNKKQPSASSAAKDPRQVSSMKRASLAALSMILLVCFLPEAASASLSTPRKKGKAGTTVAHITVYNWKGSFIRGGWGFFVNERGDLVTWSHLLEGGSFAEATVFSGETRTITRILSEDQEGGLVVAGLDYPPDRINHVEKGGSFPPEGSRIFVGGGAGCDPGTFVDGSVVSARKIPIHGKMFKISSPFAASGSPVFDEEGLLVGVVFLKPDGSGNGAWAVPIDRLDQILKAERDPVDYHLWSEGRRQGWFDGPTGSYLAGLVYYWAGDFKNALPYLGRAAADERYARETLFLMGCCYDALGGYDNALDAYTMAVKLGNRSSECFLALSEAFLKIGDPDQAVKYCWQAIRMNHTDSRAFLVLSGIYNSTGAFRNALACSYAAIRFEPSLVDAYVEAGISFRCMGLHYDAARVLRKALAIKPDSGAAYWQLALTYYYSGDLSSALEICQALKSINPGLSRRLFAGLVRY